MHRSGRRVHLLKSTSLAAARLRWILADQTLTYVDGA